MTGDRDTEGADPSEQDKRSSETTEADKVAPDDRHKTEKLARHDGVDPNAGQE
ncbi:hypothetical protein HZF05_10130 [Sphingomonas sp. CGMCC 1.13654]|uniref:Uncharacterized protein n=1 Tax=Sphingomonas chungangi TaxID=2683589 RepID=A0A838L5L5_9SPHN|nr:hypothetical protein [Sphingomonas chungangi]MBA2934454.1 hypothetical protein [Sphingomonas chungangi]MVW57493.1 hypothetical protein [Sphingomonas chungangi]